MALTLIRHPPVYNPRGLCYGQYEIPLDRNVFADYVSKIKGELEVRAKEIGNLPLRVISSPSNRCRILAEKVFTESEITYDSRIKELNFGAWEGQPWDNISHKDVTAWSHDFVKQAPPEGESWIDLAERIDVVLSETQEKPEFHWVWLTHGGPIRTVFCLLSNKDLRDGFNWRVDLGMVCGAENFAHYLQSHQ